MPDVDNKDYPLATRHVSSAVSEGVVEQDTGLVTPPLRLSVNGQATLACWDLGRQSHTEFQFGIVDNRA